ncbi:unnamed protein product [Cylindrotheca closterium]|uniref:Cyclin N-terminal domain-containing protein n=1 Tax=Cylindrotheca closterium TaxID=2856 RepID=A0AAD2FQ10_9STRA|nr:unnamed protein product [Cylindrotheca closterium]
MSTNTRSRTINETRDRLNHMKELECSAYKRPLRVIEPFNGQWRKLIIEWMFSITHYCGLRHGAVAAAVYYLDASVEKGLIKSRQDYQVAAMTAFHLGLKVYDSPSIRMIRLESLVKLGSGGFGEKEVLEMEGKMLFALEWRMNPPTASCFLSQYLDLLPTHNMQPHVRTKIELTALRLIERTMSTDYFSLMESSLLAHAALLLALDTMPPNKLDVELVGNFFIDLAQVTYVERDSHSLCRSILLLDCIANGQPVPWHELDDCTGKKAGQTKSWEQAYAGPQHSPRGYDLQ